MLGIAGCPHTAHRRYVLGIAMAAVVALTILAPSSAHASGCTDSWTNNKGGSWFAPGNWSKGVPTSADEACITENGTYTVEMTQTSSTVSLKALTVGGTSGTQTLAVGSSVSLNAILTTTAGITNDAQGAITLTNGDPASNSVTLVGPIANAGTITTEVAHGGTRNLQGAVTNTGTLAIKADTAYNGASNALSNEGALNVAEGKALTVSNKSSITNGSGGKIAASGSGNVLIGSGTSFTEGAGTTSGSKPVIVDDAALSYTGSGASTIAVRGEGNTLSGSLASGQALSIESTVFEHAKVTAAGGFTNAGSITLANGDTASNNATLVISSGTLSNSGTITTEAGAGGQRNLQGNLTNTGTLAINANTSYNGKGALLSNEGALNIAEGKALTVANEGSVMNGAGGKIVATGSGELLMEPATSFTEGAGTTSGTKPVIVRDAALSYAGAGSSAIAVRGESGTLSGNLSSGQSLSIESTVSEHAKTTVGAGFTNAGSITLTNGDGASNNATLVVSSGTLSNSGTLTTQPANGGARTIQGNITNSGTLAINANTSYNGKGALLSNEGALNLATAAQLTVSAEGSVMNGAGGKIVATGSGDVLMEPGTSFNEGAGTTSGSTPVIVRDAALSYSGAGASLIALHGEGNTLSGNLANGQSLSIESTSAEHAKVTAASGFTNAGSITLTNGDTASNNATLAISSGTLSNSGTITSEPAHGGARTLQGNVSNSGTLAINANTTDNATSPTLVNNGAIDIANGVALSVPNKPTISNEAGGTIAGAGTGALVQTGGAFNEGLGKTTGSEPVILDDLALNYTNKGASTIALRGASTLSGAINKGQTLSIQSSCSEHATTTASGFLNSGAIDLTNGDGCANNATLNLVGGTLENKGTINSESPHGGTRAITGSLVNNKTVSLSAGETLKISGAYTQSHKGTLTTAIAGASSFGALSATGAATTEGKLKVTQVKPFVGTLGQTFAFVAGSSHTGTFSKVSGIAIKKSLPGLYYKTTYSATAVTLVVTQAAVALSKTEGAPGSSVTLTGSGFPAGDTVTLTFTDHAHKKTTFTSATTGAGGEFSTEVTIPAAALGAAKITAKSKLAGVSVVDAFTVT